MAESPYLPKHLVIPQVVDSSRTRFVPHEWTRRFTFGFAKGLTEGEWKSDHNHDSIMSGMRHVAPSAKSVMILMKTTFAFDKADPYVTHLSSGRRMKPSRRKHPSRSGAGAVVGSKVG